MERSLKLSPVHAMRLMHFSPVEVKKHYAWKKLGKMTAEDAMKAYVELVQSKLDA